MACEIKMTDYSEGGSNLLDRVSGKISALDCKDIPKGVVICSDVDTTIITFEPPYYSGYNGRVDFIKLDGASESYVEGVIKKIKLVDTAMKVNFTIAIDRMVYPTRDIEIQIRHKSLEEGFK